MADIRDNKMRWPGDVMAEAAQNIAAHEMRRADEAEARVAELEAENENLQHEADVYEQNWHNCAKTRSNLEARLAEYEEMIDDLQAVAVKAEDAAEVRVAELEAENTELAQDIEAQVETEGKLRDRVAELEAALRDAIGCIEDWASYASEYFQEKHDLAGDLTRLRMVNESMQRDAVIREAGEEEQNDERQL